MRFSEPALLVLVALVDRDRHGWSIMEEVDRLAGRRLGPGTLYGAISRLEAAGLVEALPGDGRRRPYRLTERGAEAVAAEIGRLDSLAREATRRLRARPAAT
jgi:DNA-binding PadR family transcriptional regulator